MSSLALIYRPKRYLLVYKTKKVTCNGGFFRFIPYPDNNPGINNISMPSFITQTTEIITKHVSSDFGWFIIAITSNNQSAES